MLYLIFGSTIVRITSNICKHQHLINTLDVIQRVISIIELFFDSVIFWPIHSTAFFR